MYDVDGRLAWRGVAGAVALVSESYAYDARDKVVQVTTHLTLNRNAETVYRQFYSGLGNLVMTDWAK